MHGKGQGHHITTVIGMAHLSRLHILTESFISPRGDTFVFKIIFLILSDSQLFYVIKLMSSSDIITNAISTKTTVHINLPNIHYYIRNYAEFFIHITSSTVAMSIDLGI